MELIRYTLCNDPYCFTPQAVDGMTLEQVQSIWVKPAEERKLTHAEYRAKWLAEQKANSDYI